MGRVHATAVGHAVPAFYTKRKLKKLKRQSLKKHVKRTVYLPPRIKRKHAKRKLVVGVAAPGWHAKVKVKPRKARGAGWYVRKSAKGRLIAGVKIKGKRVRVFKAGKARSLRAHRPRFGIHRPGVKRRVKVGARGAVKVGVKKPGVKKEVTVGARGGVKVKTTGPGKDKTVRVGPNGRTSVKVHKGGAKKAVDIRAHGKVGVGIKHRKKGGVKVRGKNK